jgi:hypothetical protein
MTARTAYAIRARSAAVPPRASRARTRGAPVAGAAFVIRRESNLETRPTRARAHPRIGVDARQIG